MPVATRALPFDQAMTSAGIASMRDVGFDSGKMIGRSVPADMASMTSCVNAPWAVEVPIRIVGFTFLTVPASVIGRPPHPDTSAAGRAYGCW